MMEETRFVHCFDVLNLAVKNGTEQNIYIYSPTMEKLHLETYILKIIAVFVLGIRRQSKNCPRPSKSLVIKPRFLLFFSHEFWHEVPNQHYQ